MQISSNQTTTITVQQKDSHAMPNPTILLSKTSIVVANTEILNSHDHFASPQINVWPPGHGDLSLKTLLQVFTSN